LRRVTISSPAHTVSSTKEISSVKIFAVGLLLSLSVTSAFGTTAPGTTWIGTISDSHCGPDHKALPGDDPQCIIFMAADKQIYKIANPEAVKDHIGHEVSIEGTFDDEITMGVTYTTQGIIHVDKLTMMTPVNVTSGEQKQFQAWMKSVPPEVAAMRAAIVAKDNRTVAAQAAKLAATFDLVLNFWNSRNNENASHFAAEARDTAKVLASSTSQFEQVMAQQKLNAACQNCHVAHRAGKPGAFLIEK
jgi:hypothetical protein